MKTPYNFIPLNERVFCPDWSENVSMDFPFEDGLFGQIRYRLVAETPVFVDDGHDNFCSRNGEKYIPATSIKGCIRNVLRIISFGRIGDITKQRVGRHTQIYSEPREHQQTQSPDLADLIFGYVRGRDALRGRVQFSPCVCTEECARQQTTNLNLYSPHPDSKALYGRPVPSDDATPEVKGWKRYVMKPYQTSNMGQSTLNPIEEGSVFEGTVRFFNLRPLELGALLSAMSFFGHDPKDEFFHQIGQGKPYGYGRVRLHILACETHKNLDVLEHSSAIRPAQDAFSFLDYINDFVNGLINAGFSLANNPSITEFLTMCHFVATADDERFSYMGQHANDHTPIPPLSEIVQESCPFPGVDKEILRKYYQEWQDKQDFLSAARKGLEEENEAVLRQAVDIYVNKLKANQKKCEALYQIVRENLDGAISFRNFANLGFQKDDEGLLGDAEENLTKAKEIFETAKREGQSGIEVYQARYDEILEHLKKIKFVRTANLGLSNRSKELLGEAKDLYNALNEENKAKSALLYADVMNAYLTLGQSGIARDPKADIEKASSIEGLVNNALKWDGATMTPDILQALQGKMKELLSKIKKNGLKGKTINAIAQLNNRLKDNPDWIEIKVE